MKINIKLIFAIFLLILAQGCGGGSGSNIDPVDDDYRQSMRSFVQGISTYARGINSNFIIIPQNGHALLTVNGETTGEPSADYIAAISGVGREDLFYGYDEDNVSTPEDVRNEMIAFMDIAKNNDLQVLVTDYCSSHGNMDNSYEENNLNGYISFAADQRELNNIPDYPATPFNENSNNITSLTDAKNFLYLLNPDSFASKDDFINAIANTNYDLIIIDLFFQGEEQLSATDISALKTKNNGGTRLVISYISIGEAEDYRYYWQSDWNIGNPSWIIQENENWSGNYIVEYWSSDWQEIIFDNNDSYLKRIIDAGFDGVYLDIIDAYEFFESNG